MASQKDEHFGRIAVEGGYVTHQQLDEALENQRVMRESMGMHAALADVLVHKRLLTKDQARDIKHEVELRTGEVHLVAGYEIVSKIGEGNFGVVYKARQVGTDDIVALKIILPTKADEETINRFRREAETVRTLDHDNIVKFVEFNYDRRRKHYFYAMEFVDGEELYERIERRGRLTEDEAVSITGQIAMALQHASFYGLVHRDVKPENIMVTADGTAKLCDLGLARPADGEATRMTQSGMFVGTAFYASPEQVVDPSSVDIRSDIYSLGATLYHMVTGRPPFEGATAIDILRQHLDEKAPWPADINPRLSEGLCRIIMKMMAKTPDDRYQEPNDLNDALDLLDVGQEPEIDDEVRKTSVIALPARPAPGRPAQPPAVRRRAVSRALARPRCHICGMSLDPRAVARGGHLCPSCGTEAPVVPLMETREEGRTAVVVARGGCSYDGFVRSLDPVMNAVLTKEPAEVVLDISGLRQVTADLASYIVPWMARVQACGGALKVLCSHEARRKFEMIGLAKLMTIEETAPDMRLVRYPVDLGLSQPVGKGMEGPQQITPTPAETPLRAVETPAGVRPPAARDVPPARPEGEAAGTPAEARPSPVAEIAPHRGRREKEPRQHRRYALPYGAKQVILLMVFLGVAAGATVALTLFRRGGKTTTLSPPAEPPARRQKESAEAEPPPSRAEPSASAEPASPEESWQPIFNGRDMTGWEHATGAVHVKHEALALEQYALVYYAAEWAEFVIECEITGAAALGGGGGECVMGLGLACEGTEPHERRIDVVFMKDGTAEARVDDERKGEFPARFSLDEWAYVKLVLTRNALECSGKDGWIGTVDVSGVPAMKGGILFYSYGAAYAQMRNVRVRVLSR